MLDALDLIGPPGDRVDGVERIAVLRANGLGDYLFAEPALRSLKSAYPDAELTLVGAPWHAEALRDRPGPVDRVLVAPAVPGVREPQPGFAYSGPAELEAFFRRARAARYDLALQMHGGGKNSNPFLASMGARVTAGFATPEAPRLDRTLAYRYYQPEVVRYLELAALAGAAPVALAPRWSVTREDRGRLTRALSRLGARATGALPRADAPLVVVCPGAGDGRRRWPADAFGRMAGALVRDGAVVAVTGSAGERRLTSRVQEVAGRPLADLGGALSLGALSALFERADLVLANDSGSVHLARAVGTPTVAVYWCGNLINAGPLANARHRSLLSWRLACPVCGADCTREGCDHDESFVAEVPEGEVLAECRELLTSARRQVMTASRRG